MYQAVFLLWIATEKTARNNSTCSSFVICKLRLCCTNRLSVSTLNGRQNYNDLFTLLQCEVWEEGVLSLARGELKVTFWVECKRSVSNNTDKVRGYPHLSVYLTLEGVFAFQRMINKPNEIDLRALFSRRQAEANAIYKRCRLSHF